MVAGDMFTSGVIYVLMSRTPSSAAAGHPLEPAAAQFIMMGSGTGLTPDLPVFD